MFAFLNMLFRCATLIVEDDDPFGEANEVRHNEANTGLEFAWMSLDLGEEMSASHLAMTQDQILQKEENMAYSKPD